MVWFPERRFEKVVLDLVIFFFKSNIVSYQFKYLSISLSINLIISWKISWMLGRINLWEQL